MKYTGVYCKLTLDTMLNYSEWLITSSMVEVPSGSID